MRRLYRMCEKGVWWHRAIDHGEICFLSSHDSTDWKTPIKNSDQLPIKKYCKCWLIYHPTSFNKSLVGVILMVIPVFLWARTGTCFCAHHAACGKSHKMTAAVLNNKKATTLIIPTMTSQAVLRLFYTTWIPFMEIEWYCWYLWLCLYKSDNMS